MNNQQVEEKINDPKSENPEMIWLKSENCRMSKIISVYDNNLTYLNTKTENSDFQILPKELQLEQFKSEIDQRTNTAEIKPQITANKTFNLVEQSSKN